MSGDDNDRDGGKMMTTEMLMMILNILTIMAELKVQMNRQQWVHPRYFCLFP